MTTLDQEWSEFLLKNNVDITYPCINETKKENIKIKKTIPFLGKSSSISENTNTNTNTNTNSSTSENSHVIPNSNLQSSLSEIVVNDYQLSISTQTKVLFLNCPINIEDIFWKIPVIEYWQPKNGVIKKQMKIISKNKDEYIAYQLKLQGIKMFDEQIIKQIDNPLARSIKFKDERKLTIGISKKDLLLTNKKKNAFFNCFALVIRFKFDNIFREIHIKVFNTGKMEIPGLANENIYHIVRKMILEILQDCIQDTLLFYIDDDMKTDNNILINSNFNCGFFIQRDFLYAILISKYEIETSYDPCTYPGIKCKFYFKNNLNFDSVTQDGRVDIEDNKLKLKELNDCKKYTEISFMIFRTGSCLIVGNCNTNIIHFVFEFIRNVLTNEYSQIVLPSDTECLKKKTKKIKKKNISLSNKT